MFGKPRRFKYNLQESVDMCVKMLKEAQSQSEVNQSEVRYWIQRIHGYQNIAAKRGQSLIVPELPQY